MTITRDDGTPIVLNRDVAKHVLEIVDHGLSHGLGYPTPGEMCVEAAVCFALGLPHDDDPRCVAPMLRTLKINLNDCPWSSNAARARGLRRLAIAQLGTKGQLDSVEFENRLAKLALETLVPKAFEKVGYKGPVPTSWLAFENLSRVLEERAWEHIRTQRAATSAQTFCLAMSDLLSAHGRGMTTYFGSHVVYVAHHLARIDSLDYSASYDDDMSWFGEEVVKILVALGARGCEWLDLTEAQEQVA